MEKTSATKKVVVIGGGFAGLNLVMQLKNKPGFEVTLVDKNNYNFFPPLLYQVATGFLEPSSISYPFRRFLRGKYNVRFRMADLLKIVPEENKVVLSNGTLSYDYLVMATGAESNFFGMVNVERSAIPMKTLSDALYMRNTLLDRLEEATRINDMDRMKKLATIVVAGAGPTGVELSGMFAEMRSKIIRKDYPELSGRHIGDIYLVDGGKAVLGPMSVKSQQYSKESLEKLGVKVKLGVTVKEFKDDTVYLSDDTTISTATLIWAAGVTAKTFAGFPTEIYGRSRRMIVDAFNKIEGFSNIYALGDTCFQTTDPAFPNGHPQLAQVAIQQAKNLGKNLVLPKERWKPFRYVDKGSMAIIGRNKAVADIEKPKLHFNGFIAWMVWLFIHVMSLLNFRNRLRTLYNWVGAYFTMDQYFRMIIKPEDREPEPEN
ncbi:NAD(P)/FAD-dependent oxidoreductase [Niabella beijingensis]|uniref:NAD(P)/FAD-dependent oxidoreductase n=1 Tax=Niabella beijingensis TaxID=2872700 RepID=UPI001CBFEEA1|nr:NAD(P)/FAD-dependent oxidoreductase [Niabella beijingensis]MBZ4189705.1 NAD(P)/FAD-dependent oxidoreductase [Niabella beijingensis]